MHKTFMKEWQITWIIYSFNHFETYDHLYSVLVMIKKCIFVSMHVLAGIHVHGYSDVLSVLRMETSIEITMLLWNYLKFNE